jgi:hypothetical protein
MKRTIKLALIYIVLQFVCSGVAAVIATIAHWDTFAAASTSGTSAQEMVRDVMGSMVTPMAIATIVSGLLMVWYLVRTRQVALHRGTFAEVPTRLKLLCLPFVLGAMVTCNLLTDACELPNVAGDLFVEMSRTGWGFLAIVVVAPIVEELLFRGAMEGHMLQQGKSPRMAIFLSALVFGIIHFNPAQSLFAFLLGLAFGWLYYRTGSVVPGIVGHMLNNAVCAVLMICTPESATESVVEQFGWPLYSLFFVLALAALVGGYVLVRRNTMIQTEEAAV